MIKKFNPSGCAGFIFVIAVSTIFIFETFGLNFILGKSSYWQLDGADITQHIAGINLYLLSPWHLPLLWFDSLNYPTGTTVTFVDGIPMLALLLKIILPKDIGFLNPLGYWIGFCFILQGIAAWWITKELEVKSWFFLIFLLVIFLTFPALLARLRHAALMSHWIILFSIAIYLRGLRLNCFPVFGWTILLLTAFYIHIYLFLMAYGIYVVAVLTNRQKINWRWIVNLFVPTSLLIISFFLFLYPLPENSVKLTGGFGGYSMNLLSPLLGGKIFQIKANIMSGQDEGINYLGLGVICAFLIAALGWPFACHKIMKKHVMLFFLVFIYALYSLSSNIYFGQHLVATVNYSHYLDFFTGQFRCSGRFFWPAGYVIIIFSLTILYRHLTPVFFRILISILLIIQLLDVSGFYNALKISRFRPFVHSINYSELDGLLNNNIKYIYFYPKFHCAKGVRTDSLAMMRYVALHHLKMNTGYIARYFPSCNDVQSEIQSSSRAESIYIFSKTGYHNIDQIYSLMGGKQKVDCKILNFAYVCQFNVDLSNANISNRGSQ